MRLISYLQKLGPVRAILGGTMGRVALIDAGLQDEVEISPRRRPSQSIRDLDGQCDIIFLLNLAKSRESGLVFGAMVAQAAGEGRPLIQIDCGGRFVCLLRGEEEAATLAGSLALDLGLDLLFSNSVPGIGCQGKRGTVRRILSSVFPGELISVNGTVVGRAIESRGPLTAAVLITHMIRSLARWACCGGGSSSSSRSDTTEQQWADDKHFWTGHAGHLCDRTVVHQAVNAVQCASFYFDPSGVVCHVKCTMGGVMHRGCMQGQACCCPVHMSCGEATNTRLLLP